MFMTEAPTRKSRAGVSPVVATILLIAITVVVIGVVAAFVATPGTTTTTTTTGTTTSSTTTPSTTTTTTSPTTTTTTPPPTQYVCTFFYPWYGGQDNPYRHWSDSNHNPPSTWSANYLPDPRPESFDPANELYSSDNDEIILWEIDAMKRAGIRVAISSWWGVGDYTDQAFSEIITVMSRPENPYPGLKWAIYYEGEGYGNPSVDNICADLSYIDNNYGSSPYYFKIDGKIVVFVYGDASDGAAYAQRWDNVRSRLGNVYVVLKVFGGYLNYASCADSWHQYAPDKDYEAQAPYSAFVSPGFWKYDEGFQRLPRNLSEFESAVQTLMNSGYKFLLIQTWNEWHEGTQIEPGQLINHDDSSPPFTEAENSYGYDYIDILAKYTNPQS